jgi:hypothetical protein
VCIYRLKVYSIKFISRDYREKGGGGYIKPQVTLRPQTNLDPPPLPPTLSENISRRSYICTRVAWLTMVGGYIGGGIGGVKDEKKSSGAEAATKGAQ